MDKLEQEVGHLKDLALRAEKNYYPTASDFYGVSDRSHLNAFFNQEMVGGVLLKLIGGNIEAERVRYLFLPEGYSEIDVEEWIACFHIAPKSFAFASPIEHRDVLGALMSLGIKRESIGDIYIEGNEAEIYAFPSLEEEILTNLTSIKNNRVIVKRIPCDQARFTPKFIIKKDSVSSLRLDAILASIFHLSREEAKRNIEAKRVFVTSLDNPKPDSEIKINDHISFQGHGKAIYLGEAGTSKKGRIIIAYKCTF